MVGGASDNDSESGGDQAEMIFTEIHKQAMANVLLDITGRIGTRQRDASAIPPLKNPRASTVMTAQAIRDFAAHGVAVVDNAMDLDGNIVRSQHTSENLSPLND
jgi:hypothetical protein